MSLRKFLDPKNDYAFKRIFGSEKNKDILIHFLNDILEFHGDKAIQKVTYLKTHQDPEIAAQKLSLVDVLCEDERGRQYIVEMQIAKIAGFEKRAQYYAAKAYSRQLDGGENYHDLKEVIFLAITDFVMFPDKQDYKCNHVILDKVTHSHDLKDFSFTFLELPKFHKGIDELNTMLDKWAYFFRYAEETTDAELAQIVERDPVMAKAFQQLDQFSFSKTELTDYERAEKRDRDTAGAFLNARLEGVNEGRCIVAKRLLQAGIADALILESTQLTVAELQLLKD
jgi:predicted transposase/invertase (TIGR01784 family)